MHLIRMTHVCPLYNVQHHCNNVVFDSYSRTYEVNETSRLRAAVFDSLLGRSLT